MPTLGNTNLTVSSIGLGTVEIGLPYGIDVKSLPSDKEAERILKTAVELGITYFDTARGYGVAEERIGRSGISQQEGIVVGTKCGQFLKDEPNLHGADLVKRIRDEVDISRRNLKLDILPLLQLHIESPDFDNLDELVDIMQKLQNEEKVQHVGLACRGEKVPLDTLGSGFFETIQVAYSILDQRMAVKVLPAAAQNNVGVICRSVLLQGVLTPAVEKLPDRLSPLKNNSRKAARIAAELGIDLPTLAIRFAAFHPAVSITLIGTTRPKHLATTLAAVQAGPLPKTVLQKLAKLATNDPSQVDPSQWPKM
ncbi:MAG: aldo/keto reductase [bacterium]